MLLARAPPPTPTARPAAARTAHQTPPPPLRARTSPPLPGARPLRRSTAAAAAAMDAAGAGPSAAPGAGGGAPPPPPLPGLPLPSPSAAASALDFLLLAQSLKRTPRTGWLRYGVERPESIADHMHRMGLMAMVAAPEAGVDASAAIRMAIVHDVAEAIVGDITPHCNVSPEAKRAAEDAAIVRIREVLGGAGCGRAGAEVEALWREYEAGASPVAVLVKDLDKLEMIIQAHEYERDQARRRHRLCGCARAPAPQGPPPLPPPHKAAPHAPAPPAADAPPPAPPAVRTRVDHRRRGAGAAAAVVLRLDGGQVQDRCRQALGGRGVRAPRGAAGGRRRRQRRRARRQRVRPAEQHALLHFFGGPTRSLRDAGCRRPLRHGCLPHHTHIRRSMPPNCACCSPAPAPD